ncbi:hypothetical protein [Yoonia sp.]|uniref:hypothetical protein n=1 Tax=Yoonia sp. TaxID=2212373 RepID=UPI0023B63A35
MKLTILAASVTVIGTLPAFAQSYDVDITATGQAENFFEALSGDLMVTRSGSTIDNFQGLEGTPLEGATGRCFGATMFVNGVPDGLGNCVFEDQNGDRILQAWTVDTFVDGVSYGTWRFVGGTGAHEGVTGRGHFERETVGLTGANTTRIIGVASWPEAR